MKKIILFFLAAVALKADPFQLELKMGYFRFGDAHLRKVYRQDALDTQLVASGPLLIFSANTLRALQDKWAVLPSVVA